MYNNWTKTYSIKIITVIQVIIQIMQLADEQRSKLK